MSDSTRLFNALPGQHAIKVTSGHTFRIVRSRNGSWVTKLVTFVTTGVLLLAPLPGASNQPLAWLIWAMLLGATASVVSAATLTRLPLSLLNRRLFVFASVYLWFALFQALPLPGLRGGLVVTYPGGDVTLSSLSIAPGATLLASIRIATYMIFYWLMLIVARDTKRAKRIGFILFYGVALYGAFAIASLKLLGDTHLIGEKTSFLGMATGPFVNRNSFATFLGMGFVLGISLYRRRYLGRIYDLNNAVHSLALVTILTALVLTQSRMGQLATTIATLLVYFSFTQNKRSKFIAASGSLLVIIALYQAGMLQRFTDLQRSFSIRFDLYDQIVSMIFSRPITGSGLDSFPLAFELFHQAPVTSGYVWDNGHSTYLTLWAEAGLIFGTIPILAAALIAQHLYRQSRSFRPGHSMALAAFACMVLAGLHSLVDFSLEIQANAFFLLALIALGIGAGNFEKERENGL